MTAEQFARFIVDNKIGSGKLQYIRYPSIHVRDLYHLDNRSICFSELTRLYISFLLSNGNQKYIGKEIDAINMFKMMDQDKNGLMTFEEFVLILVLPKNTEEISTEQFASRKY